MSTFVILLCIESTIAPVDVRCRRRYLWRMETLKTVLHRIMMLPAEPSRLPMTTTGRMHSVDSIYQAFKISISPPVSTSLKKL